MVNKLVQETEKDGVSVQQLAKETGVTPEHLLSQFHAAGVATISSANDTVSVEQKQALLRHLQQNHGAKQEIAPEKIVLRRAKTSEIKIGGGHGAGKTVSIQVRKKRTYVKRATAEDETATKVDDALQEPSVAPAYEEPAVEVVATQPEVIPTTPVIESAPVAEAAAAAVSVEEAKIAEAAKHKEKHRVSEVEEADNDKNKKKKKTRDSGREADRNFESLLTRGADLSRVFKQE